MKRFQMAPVVHVSDLGASVAYYVSVFGFVEMFRWGDPAFYAGVDLHEVRVHLNSAASVADRVGKSNVYFFVDSGLDAYVASVIGRGGQVVGELPGDRAYGLRDVKFADLDGNWLSFGQEA